MFALLINVHSITVLFGKIRELFTGYCLFKDVNKEHVKMLFDTTLGMRRRNFDFEKFNKIYEDHTGFDDDLYAEKKQSDPHNFIYVMIRPEKHLWLNFEEKIF